MNAKSVTICGLLILALGAFSLSPVTYTVQDLGTLGGVSSDAHAISGDGDVAGMSRDSDGNEHAFLWTEGVMEDLGTLRPGSTALSDAYGVNSSGVVVGFSDLYSEEWGLVFHAFIWEDGVMSDLGTLGGPYSSAFAINDDGTAVGWADLSVQERSHATLWHGGRTKDLGSIMPDWSSTAYAISSNGIVVGSCEVDSEHNVHACIWVGNHPHDLGTLGGAWSYAFGVNRYAEVAGASQNSDGEWRAFLWKEGNMLDLGTLGGARSWGFAINDSGQVVGYSYNPNGGQDAFIWSDGTMTDLPNLGGSCGAEGINNGGSIVGSCTDPESAEGHAVLWTQ